MSFAQKSRIANQKLQVLKGKCSFCGEHVTQSLVWDGRKTQTSVFYITNFTKSAIKKIPNIMNEAADAVDAHYQACAEDINAPPAGVKTVSPKVGHFICSFSLEYLSNLILREHSEILCSQCKY
mmetsp:Transcript_16673/g.22048  ORF Transcript_16673/g.22048 Transcript_16673/m.22048 type:complete len:124 (+) Transcript_16673:260-631(+)